MNGESNQGAKKHKANGGNGSSASPEVLMKMMMNMQQEMNAMKHKMLEMEVKLSNYDELEKECHSLRRQLNASVAMSAQQTAMSAMLFNALQEQSTVNRRLTQYAEELNTKMESLERSSKAQFLFHRQLIDNQSWEYSAPIPEVDSPFWVDEGYEEEDVQKFVLVLSRIKQATTRMRHGRHFEDGLSVGSGLDWNEEGQAPLPWLDLMYGHWSEFADALAQYRFYLDQCPNRNEFSLYFGGVVLKPYVLEMLQKALRGIHLDELELEYNDSGHSLISFVANVLKSDPGCRLLSLTGNPFEQNDESNDLLFEAIGNLPLLRTLNMNNCFNGSPFHLSVINPSSSALLGRALPNCRQLNRMDLRSNDISGESVSYIADFLATSPNMIELDMYDNPLNDQDAAKIATALGTNRTLRLLQVGGSKSKVTEVGARALRKSVYGDEKSLNSIANANHVCDIRSNWRLTCCNSKDESPQQNRAWKIYHALKREYNNNCADALELIDRELPDNETDLAVKLMPQLLHCIQLYAFISGGLRQRHEAERIAGPLCLLYEIKKGWRMPTLYERAASPPTVDID